MLLQQPLPLDQWHSAGLVVLEFRYIDLLAVKDGALTHVASRSVSLVALLAPVTTEKQSVRACESLTVQRDALLVMQ